MWGWGSSSSRHFSVATDPRGVYLWPLAWAAVEQSYGHTRWSDRGFPFVELQAHVGVSRPAFPGFDGGTPRPRRCPPHSQMPGIRREIGLRRTAGHRAHRTFLGFHEERKRTLWAFRQGERVSDGKNRMNESSRSSASPTDARFHGPLPTMDRVPQGSRAPVTPNALVDLAVIGSRRLQGGQVGGSCAVACKCGAH